MDSDRPPRVAWALDALLEALREELEVINAEGAAAFEAGRHDDAHERLEQAARVRSFRHRVTLLREDWFEARLDGGPLLIGGYLVSGRPRPARLRPGERTAEEEYREPILQVLAEAGGSATSAEALALVEIRMRDRLRAVDYQPTRSNPRVPRWRISAQRARNRLVGEGLLRADSPRGLWELSDAGQARVAEPAFDSRRDTTALQAAS